jgi:hypothetical protein
MYWIWQSARDFPPAYWCPALNAVGLRQPNADKVLSVIIIYPVQTNIVLSLHTKLSVSLTFVLISICYMCRSWKIFFWEVQYCEFGALLTVLTSIQYICPLIMTYSRQAVEAPSFRDCWHTKVLRLSAQLTGSLYHQEIFLVLISARDLVDPRAIVEPEVLCQWKVQFGIFRLVA